VLSSRASAVSRWHALHGLPASGVSAGIVSVRLVPGDRQDEVGAEGRRWAERPGWGSGEGFLYGADAGGGGEGVANGS
jgi:hypothetical protein